MLPTWKDDVAAAKGILRAAIVAVPDNITQLCLTAISGSANACRTCAYL
jgi:hypothetical protein